jgi:acyl-CoA dehydrogenase
MHSQDTAELIFEVARVPVANLLGVEGKGFYFMMNKLQRERIFSSGDGRRNAGDQPECTAISQPIRFLQAQMKS